MPEDIYGGKYTLIRKLAVGGMAEVFLAKQRGMSGFEKLVVVKRILPHLAHDANYVRMFLDEARLAAELRHSNLVHTFEVGQEQGLHFMVMEFLHGQDLRSLYRRATAEKKAIPIEHVVGILIDANLGLDYVHRRGIIHRDISPQNIVVTYEGETKVVDFGIAKSRTQSEKTATGVLKGKYSYMSPEQVSGRTLDPRTDLFALGILLYEMTTLRRLFKRESDVLTLRAISECEVISPSSFASDYPRDLENVLLKSLDKDPDKRFQTCAEFRSALENYLHSNGIQRSTALLGSYLQEEFREQLDHEDSMEDSQLEVPGVATFSSFPPPMQKKSIWPIMLIGCILGATIGLVFWGSLREQEGILSQRQIAAQTHLPEEPITNLSHNPSFEHVKLPSSAVVQNPGRLKIVVEPWAEVYLDGRLLGSTPLAAKKLLPKNYRLDLKNPQLKKSFSATITIEPGRDTLIKHQF